MDVVAADHRALNAAIGAAIASIEQRLQAPQQRRLGAGNGLRVHARETLRSVQEQVTDRNDELAEATGNTRTVRIALTGLRRSVRLLRSLDHALDLLDRPSDELGLGVLYLIGDLASRLLDAPVDLLESPGVAPVFATRSYPLSAIHSSSATEPIPVELIYPRRQATASILAPLLVHELGHPVCSRHPLLETLLEKCRAENEFVQAITDYQAALPEAVGGPTPSTQDVLNRFSGFLEESLCDALAIACTGPSYLLAFAAWAGVDTEEGWADSHPPKYVRMELMVDQLNEHGWDLTFMDPIVTWGTSLRPARQPHTALDDARARALSCASPAIREVVGQHLRDRPCLMSVERYKEHVDAGLEDLFEQDVLPAQLDHQGRFADRACILLASWKYAMKQQAEGDEPAEPAALITIVEDTRANSFLDKALEMSAVLERWVAPA